MSKSRKIKQLRDQIGVGNCVAEELLVLSGWNVDLAVKCSRESAGLDQCKAAILNERISRIEEDIDVLFQ